MRHQKRIVSLCAPLLVAGMTLPVAVFAQQDIVTPLATQFLNLARVLVTLVFVLAIVAFGWGIVSFVMAAGDPGAVQKAKGFLLWGVIGMAVGASLFGLITFLQTYLGVQGGGLIITTPQVEGGGAAVGGAAVGGVAPPPPPAP